MIARVKAALAVLRGQPVAYKLIVTNTTDIKNKCLLAECQIERRRIGFTPRYETVK